MGGVKFFSWNGFFGSLGETKVGWCLHCLVFWLSNQVFEI